MLSDQRPSNRLLQSLPAADFEAARPHLEVVHMSRDLRLVEAGRPPGQIWLPHSGIVSLVVNLSEGQTVEVAMIGRDGAIGALEGISDGIALTDAVVLCPGTASVLAVADLKLLAGQSVAWWHLLTVHHQAVLAQAQQSVACNASHSVEERLSRWLLRAHDLRDGEPLVITQEQLARMLGVQRNAVSIVAHALQQAGVIRYRRGQIEIVDLDVLRRTACECYGAVTTKQTRLFT